MESILTQTAIKVVEEIVKSIAKEGITDVGKTAEGLLSILKEGALELLAAAITETDNTVLAAKEKRKIDGLSIKAKGIERTCITSLGELRYKRTYFEYKDGRHIYLTDYLIGIEPYERITKELCAKLVENASSMSMEKTVRAADVPVSRQSVNNKILAMKDPVKEIERVQETPPVLHLFADEDHVHLRPKRCAIVPLVTVTEGIDTTNEKRHKTINPIHFQGYNVHNDAFIENVVAGIYERYDMDKVQKICIHADGGTWIKRLREILPNAVLVMDGFHLEKYLKSIIRLKNSSPYAATLRQAIKSNDWNAFLKTCKKIYQRQDPEGKEKLYETAEYFRRNWNSIVARYSGEYCGSCTESLVSHILSERLSRNPFAWSSEGLSKMAMLRVFVSNGGIVTEKLVRISRTKMKRNRDFEDRKSGFALYKEYAEKQVEAVFDAPLNWNIFERESILPSLTNGMTTGTSIMLQSFSRLTSPAS